jgi:hypothetical protein
MSGTFAPITTAGGFTSFTETSETGWHQLDIPGPSLPVMAGTTPPDGAQGMLVYATTAVRYCFSPTTADAGATTYMELAAGQSVFVPGQTWVRNFCVLLGNGAQFSIQYTVGDIGPTPEISGSGGGTPPPTPPLTEIVTQKVHHVMLNGNDATGQPYRFDLPYATVGAITPLSEDETIVVWGGEYVNMPAFGLNCNLVLMGASISIAAGAGPGIDLPAASPGRLIRIGGTGRITKAAHTSPAPTIRNVGGCAMNWNDVVAESEDGTVFEIGGGLAEEIIINADIIQRGTGDAISGPATSSGTVTAEGNGLRVNFSGFVQRHVGRVNAIGIALLNEGGEQYGEGEFTGQYGAYIPAAAGANSVQEVYGQCIGTSKPAAMAETGFQTVYGTCIGEVEEGARSEGDAVQTVIGNCFSLADDAVYATGTSKQTINGNISGALNGAYATEGAKQYINGNAEGATGHSVVSEAVTSDGIQVYNGVLLGRNAARCTDGNQVLNGLSLGLVFAESGKVVLNSRVQISNTDPGVNLLDAATLVLGPSCVIVTASGPSIANGGTAPTATSLGAWANNAEDAGVTVLETFNVSANVQ